MKSSILIRIVITAILLFGSVASAKTTITMYDPRPNTKVGQIIDTLLAEFAAQNPDIVVEYVHIPGSYAGVREKAAVAIASNAAPNVVILDQTHWLSFALAGHLLPLNDFIAADPTVDLEDYYPLIISALTRDGSIYGLPFTLSTPIMYYNRTLFETSGLEAVPPRTWDDYVNYGRRIVRDSDGDGVNDVLMVQFYNDNWFFEAWLGQNGARVANPEGTEYTLNAPEAIETFEFLQALVQQYQMAKTGSYSSVYADFWAGKLAITEQSTAALANNLETAAQNGIALEVAPLACQKQCYAPLGGGNIHIINTGTDEEKAAAWRLVSFLQQPENLARMGAATGYMAARRSAIQEDALQERFNDEPRYLITYQQLPYASARAAAWVPNWSAFSGQFTQAVLRMLNGANVRQEADELVRIGNELIREYAAQK